LGHDLSAARDHGPELLAVDGFRCSRSGVADKPRDLLDGDTRVGRTGQSEASLKRVRIKVAIGPRSPGRPEMLRVHYSLARRSIQRRLHQISQVLLYPMKIDPLGQERCWHCFFIADYCQE